MSEPAKTGIFRRMPRKTTEELIGELAALLREAEIEFARETLPEVQHHWFDQRNAQTFEDAIRAVVRDEIQKQIRDE